MPSVKAQFGASALSDGDFFFLMADAAAEGMQYAHRDVVCNAVTPPYLARQPVLPSYVQYVNSFFYAVMGNAPSDYDSNVLANPVTGGDGRSWWWYVCTELAYWQIAPAQGSIRSGNVTAAWHQGVCNKLFGITTPPNVAATNVYYGGNTTGEPRTYYDQGVQDPWRWAGVQESLGNDTPAYVVDCDGCAHCQSLYTPLVTDPLPLQQDRDRLRVAYSQWVAAGNGP